MWQTFFNNRPLLQQAYIFVTSLMFVTYLGWLVMGEASRQWLQIGKRWLIVLLLMAIPLLPSMNALSYDVYNYIFNAKMVMTYRANPHVHTAIEFSDDTWVRFMHNIHTPAPYGYGWTIWSLIPYSMGLGSFLTTWLSFRIWSIISWLALGSTLRWLLRGKTTWWWWAVMFNPLLMIEIISTMHNDLWMVVPAMLSLGVLSRAKQLRAGSIIPSLLLLGFSISIKLATIALAPLWLAMSFSVLLPAHPLSKYVKAFWPLFASCILFVPLLTPRSQQFHPWYWMWVLSWLPLLTERTSTSPVFRLTAVLSVSWKVACLGLTGVLFWRYLPFLRLNDYTLQVLHEQKAITWIGFGVLLLLSSSWAFLTRNRYNTSQ